MMIRGVRAVGLAGAKPPVPSAPQRWIKLATSNDQIAELLKYYSANLNWYELYKAYECIRGLWGGDDKLQNKVWSPSKSERDQFTRTANYYHRHARNPGIQPPADPMTIVEATALIRTMADRTLSELAP